VPADNLTWNKIDKLEVHCRNATGCLLSIASLVGASDAGVEVAVSSKVDGVRAKPRPIFGLVGVGRQSAILTRGSHTIITEVYLVNGNNLGPWEVDYTLYEGIGNSN
jgi:hypothetical protein